MNFGRSHQIARFCTRRKRTLRRWQIEKNERKHQEYLQEQQFRVEEMCHELELEGLLMSVKEENTKKPTASFDERVQQIMEKNKAKPQSNRPLFRPKSWMEDTYGPLYLNQLPEKTMQFNGKIHLIASDKEERQVFDDYNILDRMPRILGIDTESRPQVNSGAGGEHPTCLLQIAAQDWCLLYRLRPKHEIPPLITALLSTPDILKVGHDIKSDIRHLFRYQQLGESAAVSSVFCTLQLFRRLGSLKPGLKTLSSVVLGATISKEHQLSDWESPVLSPEQQTYAATDAWIPREMFLTLLQHHQEFQQTTAEAIGLKTISKCSTLQDRQAVVQKHLRNAIRHDLLRR